MSKPQTEPFNALDHELEIEAWYVEKMRAKYRAGQDEHGGKLWRKPMVKHMIEEVIDLTVYMQTHEQQQLALLATLMEAGDILESKVEDTTAIQARALSLVEAAINIMLYGNEEGEIEEERNP